MSYRNNTKFVRCHACDTGCTFKVDHLDPPIDHIRDYKGYNAIVSRMYSGSCTQCGRILSKVKYCPPIIVDAVIRKDDLTHEELTLAKLHNPEVVIQ